MNLNSLMGFLFCFALIFSVYEYKFFQIIKCEMTFCGSGQGNLEVAAPTAEDNKGLDLGDLSEMTDEQLATLMGIDDTEGESKKERRKNKKKRGMSIFVA